MDDYYGYSGYGDEYESLTRERGERTRQNISPRELLDIFQMMSSAPSVKTFIIIDYLMKMPSQEQRCEAIKIIAKDKKQEDDLPNIVARSIGAANVVALAGDLYADNESARYNFLTNYFKVISRQSFADSIVEINKAILSFSSNNRKLQFWQDIKDGAQNLNRKQKAVILENILPDKYCDMADFLKTMKVAECFRPEFIEEGIKEMNLASFVAIKDLAGYHSNHELMDLLRPDAARKLKEQFGLIRLNHFTKDDIYQAICTQLRHDLKFPKLGSTVGEYLRPRVKAKNLSAAEMAKYQINFTGTGEKFHGQQEELNKRFRAFLLSKDGDLKYFNSYHRSDRKMDFSAYIAKKYGIEAAIGLNQRLNEIVDLFDAIGQNDLSTSLASSVSRDGLGFTQRESFCLFCLQSKQSLAHLFTEEGAIEQFAGVSFTTKDGCVVNITNQTENLLASYLIKGDPYGQVLYEYFNRVFYKMMYFTDGAIVEGEVGNVHLTTDPFEHKILNNCRICPKTFFEEIEKIFYDPNKEKDKIGRDAWDLLGKIGMIRIDGEDPELQTLLQAEAKARARDRAEARIAARITMRMNVINTENKKREDAGEKIDTATKTAQEDEVKAIVMAAEKRGDFKDEDAAKELVALREESDPKFIAQAKAVAEAALVKAKWREIFVGEDDDYRDVTPQVAKIAAYLVIKNTVPELLKHVGSKAVTEECEAVLAKVAKLNARKPEAKTVGRIRATKISNPQSRACEIM